jgi:hypothetical protein
LWTSVVGGPEAPALRVGGQSMRSFNPVAWGETLDLAGYPRQSLLPPTYQPPPATPLAERRAPAPRTTLPVAPAAAPSADPNSNPAGIRF